MNTRKALTLINNKLDLINKDKDSENELFKRLSKYLNDLVLYDFNKLINILYRVDVSERKVKVALAENKHKNPGEIIAKLIIERESEKIKYREWYKSQEGNK